MTPDDTVDILMMRTVGWTVSNGALLKGKQTWTPNVNGEHGDGKADILRRARDDKCNHVKGVKKERREKLRNTLRWNGIRDMTNHKSKTPPQPQAVTYWGRVMRGTGTPPPEEAEGLSSRHTHTW